MNREFDAELDPLPPMKEPSRTWEQIFAEVPEKPAPGLPGLQGTEKQVAWAQKIRKGKLADVEQILRQWYLLAERQEAAEHSDAAEANRRSYRAAKDVLALLQAQTSARFYIDRREFTAEDLLAWRTPEADTGKVAK